tara:strand:+ start:8201 stop:8758 length:558 start_codon:yes stop_codon:yes gene_type:complete
MKHNLKIKDLFNIKEKISLLLSFILFLSLGVYGSLTSLALGSFFIIIAPAPFMFLFIKRARHNYSEVWRITSKDNVARLNVEFWDKKDIRKLDRNYFWSLSGKLIPVGEDVNGKFQPIYVFNLPLPDVTSGHIYRSGVQEIAVDLMKKESDGIKDVVKIAGLVVVVLAMIFIIYSMWGRMLEAFN